MKLFGKQRVVRAAEGSHIRALRDDELNRVVGGQQIIPPTPYPSTPCPSTAVGTLDQWCTYAPDNGRCPYNAFPNSEYCNYCPLRIK